MNPLKVTRPVAWGGHGGGSGARLSVVGDVEIGTDESVVYNFNRSVLSYGGPPANMKINGVSPTGGGITGGQQITLYYPHGTLPLNFPAQCTFSVPTPAEATFSGNPRHTDTPTPPTHCTFNLVSVVALNSGNSIDIEWQYPVTYLSGVGSEVTVNGIGFTFASQLTATRINFVFAATPHSGDAWAFNSVGGSVPWATGYFLTLGSGNIP